MSLYEQWKEQLENQTDETFDAFWDEYSSGETKIYSSILEAGSPVIQGNISELAEKFGVDPVIFMGFLDGINTSLNTSLELETLSGADAIALDIDFDKLYFNMHKAGAGYLYDLEQWDGVLSGDRRSDIVKEYKRSKIVIKDKTPGRNDPCPCGSGKKYKKCCGA